MEEIFKLYRELRNLFGENDLGTGFRQQIHCIIQKTIDQIPDGTKIAIRPAGWDTKRTLELYDFSRKNIVGIVNRRYRGNDFCGYPCFTADSFSAKSCDCVIISSLRHRQEIKEELESLHIPYIDFYDELEKRGFQLYLPYTYYETPKEYPQRVLSYYYLRYLRSEAGPQRETALNALLQIAVEYKDFSFISNIYQDCGGEDGEFPLLKIVWRKSKHLLDCIQNKFLERKQKDIILFWADSVPYSMFHYLPETLELSKQGVSFHRAYVSTGHTNATIRAMFCNMLPIDDFPQNQEEVDNSNSSLIQFMESEGYKVRFIGDSDRVMGKEYLLETGIYESCNMKWWKGIIDLLQSPEPCFYLFHIMESHEPYDAPDSKEPVIDMGLATETQREVQLKAAFGYVDRCLLLYRKLLGNRTQIFLSDHGLSFDWDMRFKEQLLHVFCFAVGENIPKKTVTRFFPYTNFEKFVRYLMNPARLSLDDFCTDEVIVQDTDFYHPKRIEERIQEGTAKYAIAYRGIINYDYKYVINPLGEEFFFQMQQDGSEKLVPLEDSALRAELRDKCGTKFLAVGQDDKFYHSKKLYDAINQAKHS